MSGPKVGRATEKEEEVCECAEDGWNPIGAAVDVVVVEECNNETKVMGGDEPTAAADEEVQEDAGSQVGEKGSGEAAESL